MNIRRTLASTATALGIVLAAASPLAADEVIDLTAYDMNRVEDVDRLQMDIVQTATDVCKEAYANWSHGRWHRHVQICIKDAVDYAVEQAQNWNLSQLHASINEESRYNAERDQATPRSASAD